MKPRKKLSADTPAVEPTRRSSRIAEKPKPSVKEKAAAKPRTKKPATTTGGSKKREAEEEDEAEEVNNNNNNGSSIDEPQRQAKKAKADTPPKEEQEPPSTSEMGEEQDELADDQDDDIPGTLKPIEMGDSLPSVILKNEKDEDVDVAEAAAKKNLVIFLIPKADTPGCTQQACGFRDIYDEFGEFDVDIYCLSADAPSAQSKWQSKKSLPYSLLSDPQRTLITALGAADNNNKTKRSHFIFEKGGKLVERKLPVKPADSPKLALDFVKNSLKK